MMKLHVTQDDHDYWMLSLEQEDGSLTLLAHQFATPDKVLEMALERAAKLNASILIDPPRPVSTRAASESSSDYEKPQPRRAGA
jgi:hypothetical protein